MSDVVTSINVAVLGSIVFDIAVEIDRLPDTHETILASSAHLSAGGKGLCQAVAARRLGPKVDLIGLVGDDLFGEYLLGVLDDEDIGREHVHSHSAGTHLGIPMITPDGNNRIIGVPQASFAVGPTDLVGTETTLKSAEVLLIQNETPLEAIMATVERVHDQTLVVWNPAPARFSLEEMMSPVFRGRVSWLTPNETEAGALAGIDVVDVESGFAAAQIIRTNWPVVGVVVTLGDQGAVAIEPSGEQHVARPHAVNAIDPTGAGDTFTAAFAVGLASGDSVSRALDFASAAGALAATRLGAVTSIPSSTGVETFMNRGVEA